MLSVRRWKNAGRGNVYYLEANILPNILISKSDQYLKVKLCNEIIVKFACKKLLFPNPKLYHLLGKEYKKKKYLV